MSDVLSSLITVVIGISSFVLLLLVLYWLSNRLPARFQESSKVALFVGPALILLVIGLVIPAIRTTYFSFRGDGPGNPWVGFANFREIFTSQNQQDTLINNVLWVVVGTVVSTYAGLIIARYADRMRGEALAKALIFLPTAVSLAGAGIIWKFIYAGPPVKVGLLNAVTGAIPGIPANWGGNGDRLWMIEAWPINTLLLIIVLIWVQTGFSTVVFSAAIKNVPEALLEAATVDGASRNQIFRQIVIPYIRPTIITVATTTVIFALKVFDIVKAMTGGNFRTSTIANDFYATYFVQNREGYGSALATLLFVLVIPVVLINRRSQKAAEVAN
jgi:alpha-glucoside transport system permease protein